MLSFLVFVNLLVSCYLAYGLRLVLGRRGWRLRHAQSMLCPSCQQEQALQDVNAVFRVARRQMRRAAGEATTDRFPLPDITTIEGDLR